MVSKVINTSGFGLILLCFLLPFMSFKCMQVKIIEISPIELLLHENVKAPGDMSELDNLMGGRYKNYDYGTRSDRDREMPEIRYGWSRIVALILLLISLTGLLVVAIPRSASHVSPIVFASIVLACIIFMAVSLSRIRFKPGLGKSSEFASLLSVHFSIGFWLMLFSCIGLIIYNAIAMQKRRQAETLLPYVAEPLPVAPMYSPTPPPPPPVAPEPPPVVQNDAEPPTETGPGDDTKI